MQMGPNLSARKLGSRCRILDSGRRHLRQRPIVCGDRSVFRRARIAAETDPEEAAHRRSPRYRHSWQICGFLRLQKTLVCNPGFPHDAVALQRRRPPKGFPQVAVENAAARAGRRPRVFLAEAVPIRR
jgi:hypothetical protein